MFYTIKNLHLFQFNWQRDALGNCRAQHVKPEVSMIQATGQTGS